MTSAPLGLRDRKREETRTRLELAAVTLVLRDGLDHATVDSISAMADVSPRTFFNYFDTKEDAILGIKDIDLTPEVVGQHVASLDGADVIESAVTLLLTLISPTIETKKRIDGKTLHDQRHEVLRRHPQLFGRHMAQMARMVDPLLDALTVVLEHDGSARTVDRAQAEVLLSLCGGAVRAAVKEWVAGDDSVPVESLQPRAIALVHELLDRVHQPAEMRAEAARA